MRMVGHERLYECRRLCLTHPVAVVGVEGAGAAVVVLAGVVRVGHLVEEPHVDAARVCVFNIQVCIYVCVRN